MTTASAVASTSPSFWKRCTTPRGMQSTSPSPTSTAAPSTVQVSVPLERLGYLERRADPDYLRSRRIALTDRGRAIIPVIRHAVDRTEREWAALVGREELEQLRSTLLALHTRSDETT